MHDPRGIAAALNPAQARAAGHGIGDPQAGPLLIIAGAGSGKTITLAHRVANLIAGGCDPRRLLLLTFSRRAAADMTRRTRALIGGRAGADLPWSGTFHAVANRLLRLHAFSAALDPAFTVLDRADACDLLNLARSELGLDDKRRRFPRKATCLAIYSRVVNSQIALEECLAAHYTWCQEWHDELKTLFRSYVETKQKHSVLDYDDLLLYWFHLMGEPVIAAEISTRFDHVLVDEYQDTNALQAAILRGLRPSGSGVTAVGDDAQAIYSFRAATVRNILDFPHQFDRPATVVTLEENYRSTQTILAAANAVIERAAERYSKQLFSRRESQQRPYLACVDDEAGQVEYVVERILRNREGGVDLRRQAVLFRTAHHSDALEIELGRRNIPYVKYGGLKFLEAAHVKDVLCLLRWVENPRDAVAGFRILQLLPGVGPKTARRALDVLAGAGWSLDGLGRFAPPPAAAELFSGLCQLLADINRPDGAWPGQVEAIRRWYQPLLSELYDGAEARAADLDQLEQVATGYPSRERFLSELTLDPPDASGDFAGPPLLDEDYLILSTIHSAKGQEWDAVFVLSCADGCIPSDMATDSPASIEEERRLLYVAMTRARSELHLVHPLRFYVHNQHRHGDRHVYAPRSRFLPDELLRHFERVAPARGTGDVGGPALEPNVRVDIAGRLRSMW